MAFRAGQKVVCVVADHPLGLPSPLVVGAVYTILRVSPNSNGVLLVETECPPGFSGFYTERFRPATDISIFQRMLKQKIVEPV